jgi:recombination protein RecA
MSDFFEKLQKGIEKNVKGVHASVLADSDIATNRWWVKTPAYDLNRILSGSLYKGLQSRNLVGIVGPEHTMKSSFMILCMVEAQKQGKEIVILDTEGAINGEFCKRWGLDIDTCFYVYTPFISEVRSVLAQIRETGDDNLMIGLDSVGGLDRLKQFKDAAEGEMKADQGLLQKEIRSMLKLFLNVCIQQNSIGIATGHLYGSPDKFNPGDKVGGGKAMSLFPSVLIMLKKKMLLDADKNVIGNEITASTIKNRLYPPFQTATINLNYTDGVEPYAGMLDLAIEAGEIIKSGSWYSTKGGDRIGQGAIKATAALPEFTDILDSIDNWLSDTGYSTKSDEIEEAVQLLEDENGPDK